MNNVRKRAGIAAGAALVKPNREELAEAVGGELRTLGDVVEAGERLRKAGAGAVLASLGADGAVLVDEAGVLAGISPVSVPRSTVGAGDALLAGFLAAGARGESALVEGLAWGAAAVSLLLGIIALVLSDTAAAEVLLAAFMASILVVWLVEILDHRGVLPHHHVHGAA